MSDQTALELERYGFMKTIVPAIAANMAAATIHSGMRLDWDQVVPRAMEGANACWKGIQEDRNANKSRV